LSESALAIRANALKTMESKLWMPAQKQYAFALLQDGTVNSNLTSWPATAMAFDALDPVNGAEMAARLASSTIMTDWGARPLGSASTLFDPLHYNNGAVWPFVTGFVSLAHYKYHNAPAGLFALQAIARTGFDQALGRNPELFSGRLYKPLDTAVPQQFFATSMVLTPLIRGLLGITVDMPNRRVTIAPHLPPEWDSVEVDNVPVGGGKLSFALKRTAGRIVAAVRRTGDATPLEIVFSTALPLGARVTGAEAGAAAFDKAQAGKATPYVGDLHATVSAQVMDTAELSVSYTGGRSIVPPSMPAKIGHRSEAMRVISERLDASGGYVLSLEGLAGRSYVFRLKTPGGERNETVTFPAAGANADGYTAVTLTFK
jgi:hypothetical protein